MKYGALFTPMKIGSIEVKNRFVMCAMGGTHIFNLDGSYDKTGCEYLIERAKGGVGLLVTGITPVFYRPMFQQWLHELKDAFMQTKTLTEQVHKYGSKILLQISAGNGRALHVNPKLLRVKGYDLAQYMAAPSEGLPSVFYPEVKTRALSVEEIYQYIHSFIESARMAQEAGFDGVEVHAVHEGYLMDQFTIEATNSRTDEFGGSLENRLRFPRAIIEGIKEACGRDFAVSVRYSVTSKMKGFGSGAMPGEAYKEFGRSLEESPQVARMLEVAGADMLCADNGSYDSWYWAHPPMYMPMGCNIPEAAYIKHFVNIPVICAGRMNDPDLAAESIEKGMFDGIGLARALLADPDYVHKLQSGDEKDIRPCIACHNGCLIRISQSRPISCAVNPAVLAEDQFRLVKTDSPKKVVVVGGGIGGMESARLAAKRGHSVTLFEKSDKLGGAFIAAAAMDFKEADRQLIEWYIKKVKESGAEVRLNTEATAEMIKSMKADVVIIATGAVAKKLPVKGAEKSIEAVEYLLRRKETGAKIAIVGGGLSGCEIAYELILKGKTPVIIEMLDDILKDPGLSRANRTMLVEMLQYHTVEIHTNAKAAEIMDDGLIISTKDGEKLIGADSVIIAAGYDSYDPLSDSVRRFAPEVYTVGDCADPGNLMTVIHRAYEVAYKI